MNIIAWIHLFFVIYVVSVPFVAKMPELLMLHATLLVCLLVHWHLNNDICALTLLEHVMFPETKKNDLFVQRLVGPVYQIQNHEIKTVTYILLIVTLFRFSTLPSKKTIPYIQK